MGPCRAVSGGKVGEDKKTYDEHVLHRCGEGAGDCLSGPLMRRVVHGAGQVVPLCVDDPADHCVVDGDAECRPEDLREEGCAGWDVHVMADLLVLKHELCSVPSITCYGTVDCGASGVLVSVDGVDHQTV